MAHADLVYPSREADGPGALYSLTVFSDCEVTRARLAEDAAAAGLDVRQSYPLEHLLSGGVLSLGDIVILDCPEVRGDTIGVLLRVDARVAQAGSQMIVLTRMDALEDIYACMGQADAQILVDATRGERVLAVGRALTRNRGMRVRELSADDRVTLMRLTEQVEDIARRLEDFPRAGSDGIFRFESSRREFGPADGTQDGRLRAARPPLPDPRLVRKIIARRQKRRDYFDGALFADPAWDMLLDLTAARVEHRRVSVTSLCIASGVPATTALRWISQLVEAGLFERVEDEADRRRAFIGLTDAAADAMARYFAEIGGELG